MVGLVTIVVLGGGAYVVYALKDQLFASTPTTNTLTQIPSVNDVEVINSPELDTNLPSANVPATVPENTPADLNSPAAATNPQDDPASKADADGDGLTDYQEVHTYHTDAHNPDSDGDGLYDAEEVNTFHSDPLKSDTDGDGFSDGVEVKNGFNPLGAGRLFGVPQK
jgi:hypothetical protein